MADKQKITMRRFGLLGKNISYSFSKTHFSKKFENENISDCSYVNFDIQNISEFPSIIKDTQGLKGMNVTIPYKEAVIPYLEITKKGKLVGYNTDYYGFKKSIEPFIKEHHKKALILGTGGASKGVAYALKKLDIKAKFVSRNPSSHNEMSYNSLLEEVMLNYTIIINSTPLGTHPNISEYQWF